MISCFPCVQKIFPLIWSPENGLSKHFRYSTFRTVVNPHGHVPKHLICWAFPPQTVILLSCSWSLYLLVMFIQDNNFTANKISDNKMKEMNEQKQINDLKKCKQVSVSRMPSVSIHYCMHLMGAWKWQGCWFCPLHPTLPIVLYEANVARVEVCQRLHQSMHNASAGLHLWTTKCLEDRSMVMTCSLLFCA